MTCRLVETEKAEGEALKALTFLPDLQPTPRVGSLFTASTWAALHRGGSPLAGCPRWLGLAE